MAATDRRPPVAPSLPARLGMILAEPAKALRGIDAIGGGVLDAAWLVLLAVLCFRLEELRRTLPGITRTSLETVFVKVLAPVAAELLPVGSDPEWSLLVVLGAAVGITVLAGRGQRDPSRDLELGAACFVPFFAARAVYRLLDLLPFLSPLPKICDHIATGVGLAWAATLMMMAVRVAKGRAPDTAEPTEGNMIAAYEPAGTPSRLAAAGLACVLGAAFFANAGSVSREGRVSRALKQGKEAPRFTLPRIDGQPGEVTLDQLRGQVVLLDFWATWCAPCKAMMPALHLLHAEWHPRGVQFVGINSDGPMSGRAEVEAFLRAHPAPYPMVVDTDGEVGERYKVVALPHLVLLDRTGAIRKTFWGYTSSAEIADALAAVVR